LIIKNSFSFFSRRRIIPAAYFANLLSFCSVSVLSSVPPLPPFAFFPPSRGRGHPTVSAHWIVLFFSLLQVMDSDLNSRGKWIIPSSDPHKLSRSNLSRMRQLFFPLSRVFLRKSLSLPSVVFLFIVSQTYPELFPPHLSSSCRRALSPVLWVRPFFIPALGGLTAEPFICLFNTLIPFSDLTPSLPRMKSELHMMKVLPVPLKRSLLLLDDPYYPLPGGGFP